jgi:hypothetical protein
MFQHLWAPVRTDTDTHLKCSSSQMFIGRVLRRDRKTQNGKQTEIDRLYEEMDQQAADWSGLKAGLFGRSLNGLAEAHKQFDEAREYFRNRLCIY